MLGIQIQNKKVAASAENVQECVLAEITPEKTYTIHGVVLDKHKFLCHSY